MKKKLVRFGLPVAAVALLVGGYFLWVRLTTPYHFEAVKEGVLYRSGTLEPDVLKDVIADYGIRTVVNTRANSENREEWHAKEAEACRAAGAKLVDIPMEVETPPTPAQVDEWLSILADSKRVPVLVHCEHGVVRTGMMVAAYELETTDRSNEEVWDSLPMFGHRRNTERRRPMRDFILGYRPHVHHETAAR